MKSRRIHRCRFETAGWRTIPLAQGEVLWPDGRKSRFNVRLIALPGSDGEIALVAEDLNRPAAAARSLLLKRRK